MLKNLFMISPSRIVPLLAGLMLASCAHKLPTTNPVDDFDQFVNEEPGPSQVVPAAVNEALLNGVSEPDTQPLAKSELRFDVSVSNIPAKTFFVSLVSEAGVNVVAHPEIEGTISLDLNNVSINEVLDVVRDVYGYEYSYRSGIYTIYPRKLRTQVFHIDYLDVKRVGITDTSIRIGSVSSSGGNGGNGNSNSNSQSNDSANLVGGATGGESGKSGNSSQGFTPGARVQTMTSTNFWPFLEKSLNGMIGDGEDGRFVMVNPHAGVVVVRALPVELSSIRDFLDKSELSVQRQVILETKILEVRLNENHETGINWGAISGALRLDYQASGIGDLDDVLIQGDNVTEIIFSSALGINDITKLINLLDRQGDVQVLSSPRISTVNNQKAVIRVGTDEFFVTGVSNSTTASASSVVSTPEVELTPFFSGISLDITPQISEEGDVILHVHPIVSDVQDQTKEIQLGDSNFALPLALRDVRESDSIVKAASGQVVVLGGLMQESSAEVTTKRSRLGSVPVLNLLFKHESKKLQKTELVILMRPIVVDDSEDWDRQVKQARRGIDQFEQAR